VTGIRIAPFQKHWPARAPNGDRVLEGRARRADRGRLVRRRSTVWIARKLYSVDHPAAVKAATLLRQGRRRQAQAMLETTLAQLAGAPNGNGLA
jgi:hypothetical protein